VAEKEAVLFLKKKNQKNFSPLGARFAAAPVLARTPRAPNPPVIASPCEAIHPKTRRKTHIWPQTAAPRRTPKPNGEKFFWFFFFKKRTPSLAS
jgi:hypothetical protein